MQEYRKAIVAALGAVLTFAYFAVSEGLVEEPFRSWIMVAILTATAVGVYQAPNTGGTRGNSHPD